VDRRAKYNLYLMSYRDDPEIDVEPWMVIDYRRESLNSLFHQLASFDIHLDKTSFAAYAEACDSPEQLAEEMVSHLDIEEELEDYVYLLIFELWRRLVPEKQPISIFCDELDHQIYLYENDQTRSLETLEDMLANLEYLLDNQVDEGADPQELFETVKEALAHDLESFLFDFISVQMDNENYSYAADLLEGFNTYVSSPKWFALLKARLLIASDPEEAGELIDRLIELTSGDKDLEFHIEFLSLLVQEGNQSTFLKVLNTVLSLIETEEDFRDVLSLCEDYFHCLDAERQESVIRSIAEARADRDPAEPVASSDPHVSQLKEVFTL
jgi:hypothetical protein